MTLVAIHFTSPTRIHGLPNITMLDLREPGRVSMAGWSVYVRGPAVFITSPPGWKIGVSRDHWDPAGERQHFEIPREAVCLQWADARAQLGDVKEWAMPSDDDAELEKLTAPKGKSK